MSLIRALLVAALALASPVAALAGGVTGASAGSGLCPVDGQGDTPPATCAICHLWFDTDLDTTGNYVVCIGSNTWRAVDTKGATGGGGDASTNTSSSAVGELAVFADTTGKLLRRATGTGMCELSSGVMSATTPIGSGAPVKATAPAFATNIGLATSTSPSTPAVGRLAFKTDHYFAGRGAQQVHDGTQNTFVVATTNTPTVDLQVPAYDLASHTVIWRAQTGGLGGGGDVFGPNGGVSSNQLVLFDTGTGKLVKGMTGSGTLELASGIASVQSTTGSGSYVKQTGASLINPILQQPFIIDWTLATHDHSDPSLGGNLTITTSFNATCCLATSRGGVGTASTTGTGANAFADSPAFTGDPNAPTASTGDNDASLATTGFVRQEITAAAGAGLAVTSGVLRTDSAETNFIGSGAVTGGAGNGGRAGIVATEPLSYIDNNATPTKRYVPYGNATGQCLAAATASVSIAAINASGTPSAATALCGDGTWGTCSFPGASSGSAGDIQLSDGAVGFTSVAGLAYSSGVLTLPDPGDGARGLAFRDNVTHPPAPASGLTNLESVGGELYTRVNGGAPVRLNTAANTVHVCEHTFSGTVTSVADDAVQKCSIPAASTLTRMYCYTSTGTYTVNLYERAEATPGTGTTELLTADLVCDSDGEITTGFADAAMAAHSLLVFNMQTASLAATVGLHVEYTTP